MTQKHQLLSWNWSCPRESHSKEIRSKINRSVKTPRQEYVRELHATTHKLLAQIVIDELQVHRQFFISEIFYPRVSHRYSDSFLWWLEEIRSESRSLQRDSDVKLGCSNTRIETARLIRCYDKKTRQNPTAPSSPMISQWFSEDEFGLDDPPSFSRKLSHHYC